MGSEQVDPEAKADYKQIFDSGFELPTGDLLAQIPVYGLKKWPSDNAAFRISSAACYNDAIDLAMDILRGIATSTDMPSDYFDAAFQTPMALLGSNFYLKRLSDTTAKDSGIATHTDYGCLTLLATDGLAGFEVRKRGGVDTSFRTIC